eukprot:55155_1
MSNYRMASVNSASGLIDASESGTAKEKRMVVIDNMKSDERADYLTIFNFLTSRNLRKKKTSGTKTELGAEDLMPLAKFLGFNFSERDFDEVLDLMDLNGDGTVDFEDFMHAAVPVHSDIAKESDISDRVWKSVSSNNLQITPLDYRFTARALGPVFCAANDREIHCIMGQLMRVRSGGGGAEAFGGGGGGGRMGLDMMGFGGGGGTSGSESGREGMNRETFETIIRGEIDIKSIEKSMRYRL